MTDCIDCKSNKAYDERQDDLQMRRKTENVCQRIEDYIKRETSMLVPKFSQRLADEMCHIIRQGFK